LELREEIRSEKERLRADNIMWEQQNAELEAERTRLLQALRTQAQLSSVKGFKQFGLNAEQILQLNYFATQLKKGVAAHDIVSGSHGGGGGGSAAKSNARTQHVERENEQLKEQLRRIEIKLEMYQEGQPIVMASSLAQPSSPATGNSSSNNNSNSSNSNNNPGPSQEVSLLTNEISSLRRENERLKTELPKIIQESMDEFRGTLASQAAALQANNSGGGTLTIAPPRSPR
jgi:hypothetical protein